MTTWHWIDYLIAGVLAISALTGLVRGFLKELVALAVWVMAAWLALVYAKPVAQWLGEYIQDKSARVVLAYVVIIVGTLIVGGIVNTILSFIMHRSGLSGTDRILGLGFGTVRGIFVIALVMVVIRLSALPEDDYQKKSQFYVYFTPVVNWLYRYTPDLIKRVENLEHQQAPASRGNHADISVRDFQSL